jgi:hypothetical protein
VSERAREALEEGPAVKRLMVMASVVMLAANGATSVNPPELGKYWDGLKRICVTGITPELTRLYNDAVRAMNTVGQGGGRSSNFAGVRTPEHAYGDCFQSPGLPR